MTHRRGSPFCATISLLGVCSVALVAVPAQAAEQNEKEQCINAAERGQQLRDDGKLQLAHRAFAHCARDACPAVVKTDCAQWLREIDEKTPTIVLKAHDEAGVELTNVIVVMDDSSIAATLDGKPIPVDPGEHLFHFEASGAPAVEQRLVIRPGEHDRLIQVTLVTPAAVVSAATAPAQVALASVPASAAVDEPSTPPVTESPARTRLPIPLATWILGGVAVAAFGTEAYVGLTALNQRNTDLAPGGCSPHCGSSEKSSIQTRFAVADVSLGIGLLSAGLAAYFFFTSKQSPASVAFGFVPGPGSGVGTVGARF
ncbi:MAG: hypothetical protein M3O50_15425 [Myxococcota bacterium]|nr:hypothetical protein [Myxococcota bacterium]